MLKIVEGISDINQLLNFWIKQASLRSEVREFIESKIAKILEEISNMNHLVFCRDNASMGSKPKRLIEARMVKILEDLSSNDVPEWFARMLEFKNEIPNFLLDQFKEKAEELLKAVA